MNDLTLIHYHSEPILFKPETVYVQDGNSHRGIYAKPNGLWVSVQGPDDWYEWCRSERFSLEELECAHRVVLSPSAKILRISDAVGIDAFGERYGISGDTWWRTSGLPGDGSMYHWETAIEWHRVAAEHDGVVIAPYIWERRLHRGSSWYYGWDCASGCIWNTAAIERLDMIEEDRSGIRAREYED